jgi:hypothetical protein
MCDSAQAGTQTCARASENPEPLTLALSHDGQRRLCCLCPAGRGRSGRRQRRRPGRVRGPVSPLPAVGEGGLRRRPGEGGSKPAAFFTPPCMSFPRKRESSYFSWIPACAGMTHHPLVCHSRESGNSVGFLDSCLRRNDTVLPHSFGASPCTTRNSIVPKKPPLTPNTVSCMSFPRKRESGCFSGFPLARE